MNVLSSTVYQLWRSYHPSWCITIGDRFFSIYSVVELIYLVSIATTIGYVIYTDPGLDSNFFTVGGIALAIVLWAVVCFMFVLIWRRFFWKYGPLVFGMNINTMTKLLIDHHTNMTNHKATRLCNVITSDVARDHHISYDAIKMLPNIVESERSRHPRVQQLWKVLDVAIFVKLERLSGYH